jgi:hypothetical protein
MKTAPISRQFWTATVAGLLAAVLGASAIGIASAEDSQSLPSAAQQAPAPAVPLAPPALPQQPPPAFQPGFLHQLGVWWNDGFAGFGDKMKNAKDKIDGLNKTEGQAAKDAGAATGEALKNAAQAVVRLPNTRMFELHNRCPAAGNGAPDCPTAANNACHDKGFNSGQPLSISTQQVCPPKVLISGRPPAEGECHDETYILGVVCQ